LSGQLQFEFGQQEAELGFGLSTAGEQQLATVGDRQVHVDHLHLAIRPVFHQLEARILRFLNASSTATSSR
jgi:hypothetical protein